MESKNKNILIVEDSAVDARLLYKFLKDLDFEIEAVVSSGEDAISTALKNRPSLIVMDILLEGDIDGITASRIIRKEFDVPIVFSSSLSDAKTLEKLEIADSFGYLLKPFRKRDLYVTIDLAFRRHRFETKLEESERRYHNLFEKSKDAIFVADREGYFLNGNEALKTLFGIENDEMYTMSIGDLALSDEELAKYKSEISKNDHVKDFEMQLRRKDGRTLYCHVTTNAVHTTTGGARYEQGIIRDITEKKMAEQALEQHVFGLERAMYEIEELNEQLQQKVDDLNEAYRQISLSEEKYRRLVEGSNDIIFSLDDQYRFLTANKALVHQLQIQPEAVRDKHILELIHADQEELEVSRSVVTSKLNELVEQRQPVAFKAYFKSKYTVEPKELQVKLEYVNIKGKNEILGKASRVMDDVLMKHFVSEQQKFRIDNSLVTADEITYRLTRNVAKYLPVREGTLLRVALREIIINAIEHGNLNISFEDKSRAIMENRYIHFIAERQKDPVCRNRRVTIDYEVSPEKVIYRICDEGKGFDYQSMLEKDIEELNESMTAHGRGLKLSQEFFDTISFNELGNEVFLVRYFADGSEKK